MSSKVSVSCPHCSAALKIDVEAGVVVDHTPPASDKEKIDFDERLQQMKADKERLVVTVSKEKQVYINKTAFTIPDLQTKLTSIVEKNPGKEVFLRADKTVAYGFVVEVMAAIKEAGISKLGMVTEVSEIKD